MEDATYVSSDTGYPYIYFGGKNKKQINDLVNEILLQSDVLHDTMLDLKNMQPGDNGVKITKDTLKQLIKQQLSEQYKIAGAPDQEEEPDPTDPENQWFKDPGIPVGRSI